MDAGTDGTSARTILVVEDEATLASALSYNLRKAGYKVVEARDGAVALREARRARPDAIVLDLMLPQIDGLEVCRRVRAESDVPILMLTAKSEEIDKVVGLELGADDYMTKPFGMRELMARLRALLRRSGPGRRVEGGQRLVAGDIELDARGRTVRKAGREVTLKPKEFDLLYFLVNQAGRVFSRDQLLEHVWGYEFFGGSRTVDVHMRWLREKLEERPAEPRHLLTVRGVGYKFVR